MQNKPNAKFDLYNAIPKICKEISLLNPGDLARLCRMDPFGPGEMEFWKIAVSHDLRTDRTGMILVKLFAILTPKGKPGEKQLHNRDIPLGKVLAIGKAGKPLLSEMRLLRFIALPFDKRSESLERICRLISTNGHKGIDCTGVAMLLFYSDVKHTRRLAHCYFSNLDTTLNKKEPDT